RRASGRIRYRSTGTAPCRRGSRGCRPADGRSRAASWDWGSGPAGRRRRVRPPAWPRRRSFRWTFGIFPGGPGSDRHEPVAIALVASGDDVEEQRLELLGDGAAASVADPAVVELADRRDLGRRAREEGLVRDVHLVAGDALLDHLDAEVPGDGDHGIAGDAVEAAGEVRRVEPTG